MTPIVVPLGQRRGRPEWPNETDIDLARLTAAGWRPTPISEFVVKVASRCNLDCGYCYVYHHADQGWRRQPAVISDEVLDALVSRIRDHALAWRLPAVGVALHGGEPLLLGPDRLDRMFTGLRARLGDVSELVLMCQTNATLVTAEIADVLARHDVRVGVSLDGSRTANDRHRVYRDGHSSYDDVLAGIARLRAAGPRVFSGLLATIDLGNDPVEVYEAIAALDPGHCDLLLPHGNWSSPPPRLDPAAGHAPYADWLIPVFDRWYARPAQNLTIRFFADVMTLLLGGHGVFEMLGTEPVGLVTIETDGSIELVDTLKTAYEGAAGTRFNVLTHSLDDVLTHPGVIARQIGLDGLAPECRACREVSVCGGGLYPHRYLAGSGFLNRSVYCQDMLALIGHIRGRLAADMAVLTGRR